METATSTVATTTQAAEPTTTTSCFIDESTIDPTVNYDESDQPKFSLAYKRLKRTSRKLLSYQNNDDIILSIKSGVRKLKFTNARIYMFNVLNGDGGDRCKSLSAPEEECVANEINIENEVGSRKFKKVMKINVPFPECPAAIKVVLLANDGHVYYDVYDINQVSDPNFLDNNQLSLLLQPTG